MEVGTIVQERKAHKKGKIKKKQQPMKVVYISNPMKFKASASEFRALVQELTGQDAELPDPTRIIVDTTATTHDGVGGHPTVPDASSLKPPPPPPPAADDKAVEVPEKLDVLEGSVLELFDEDDDVFMPQMFENFSGLMPSSSLFFESTAHIDVLN